MAPSAAPPEPWTGVRKGGLSSGHGLSPPLIRDHHPSIENAARTAISTGRMLHDGIAVNEHFGNDGAVIYKHACALGCEGIVSKRLGSPYRAGRSAHWLKVRILASQLPSGGLVGDSFSELGQ